MFALARDRRVWWPVKLTTFGEDGKEKRMEIRALFRLYSRQEREALEREALEQLRDQQEALRADREAAARGELDALGLQATEAALAKLTERSEMARRNVDRVVDRVCDWRGVVDESGARVEYAPELLRDLLTYEDVLNAFLTAFAEATRGALAKN